MLTKSRVKGYTVSIRGVVHAQDDIYSPGAYARSVFGDRIHDVEFTTEGKRLEFIVRKIDHVTEDTTVAEICDGLITGDDTNVTWTVTLETE